MIVQDRGEYFERVGHLEISTSMSMVASKSTLEVYHQWERDELGGWDKLESMINGWELCFQHKKR
jgi:hypothetical protein